MKRLNRIISIHKQAVYMFPPRRGDELVQRPLDGEFRIVDGANVCDANDMVAPETLARFSNYLGEQVLGVYFYKDQAVVGYAWATLAREPSVANGYFRLRRGQALIHDCRVREAYRSRGIYRSMIAELITMLNDNPVCEQVFIDCNSTNAASMKGIERSGFMKLGIYRYVTAARWTVRHIKPNTVSCQ